MKVKASLLVWTLKTYLNRISDPVCNHGATRVRNTMENQRAAAFISSHLDLVARPLLVFHSERDPVADVRGSMKLCKEAKASFDTLAESITAGYNLHCYFIHFHNAPVVLLYNRCT